MVSFSLLSCLHVALFALQQARCHLFVLYLVERNANLSF